MRFSAIAASVLATTALAAPLRKRAAGVTDADILQYALTLEHLEATFYAEGLATYSAADFAAAGFGGSFYKNLQTIASDEKTHVAYLTAGLTAAGAMPVAACTYDFGVTSAKGFVATAKLLEGTGVSAYLGAAALISSPAYLTAAGSILTVEARHNSYISYVLGDSPFPQPFDTPLDINEVYTIAGAFIKSCPSTNVALPVKAFPALTIVSPAMPMAGNTLTLKSAGPVDKACYCAFISELNVEYTPFSGGCCEIPCDLPTGQDYVLLTSAMNATDAYIVAGPAILDLSENP